MRVPIAAALFGASLALIPLSPSDAADVAGGRSSPSMGAAARSRPLPHLALSPVTGSFAFTGGVSLPLGDFGDNESESSAKAQDAGFAGVGFCLTLRGLIDFGSTPLGWTFDASLVMHSVDEDEFEDAVYQEYAISGMSTNTSLWWVSVPILTGPAVHFSPVPGFELRASGLLGLAITRPADVTVTGDYDTEAEYTYETVPGFCGGMEAGFEISRFLILSRLLFSSLDDVDGHEDRALLGTALPVVDYEKDFSITMVHLSLGYRF